jgi:hypothetical protein
VTEIVSTNRLQELEAIIERTIEQTAEFYFAVREIRECKLYEQEGFATFDEYVSERWGRSDSWARQLIMYAGVTERTGRKDLTKEQMRALAGYPEQNQTTILELAESHAKTWGLPPNGSVIKIIGDGVMEAKRTGGVDLGDGKTTAFSASLTLEQSEKFKRQVEHIRGAKKTLSERLQDPIIERTSLLNAHINFLRWGFATYAPPEVIAEYEKRYGDYIRDIENPMVQK